MSYPSTLPLFWFAGAVLCGQVRGELLDTLVFGNDASETIHSTTAERSGFQAGGLGEPSRRLLPGGEGGWQGGILRFKVRVDPEQQKNRVRNTSTPAVATSISSATDLISSP